MAGSSDHSTNRLYFGDCLDVLREDVPDESVDLIYLDPPFNSKRLYNAYIGGAQWVAFEDTWRWYEAVEDFHAVAADVELGRVMEGLRQILGEGPNLAYLSYMTNRLRECRRVLKPTGSIYLHCDATMSHYLKVVMDALFGLAQFRSEVIWKRTFSHGSAQRYGTVHDTVLFYTAGANYQWTGALVDHDPAYIDKKFRSKDAKGWYQTISLTGPGTTSGDSGKPWKEFDPTSIGRHWAVPSRALEAIGIGSDEQSALSTREKLDALDDEDMLVSPAKSGAPPRLKHYAHHLEGVAPQDVWTDIPPVNSQAKERLGYPTQKPVALLERIIKASSHPGDVVLDPFCGCGTTIHAAQLLSRQWIGIDICVNACKVIEKRLRENLLWSQDVEFVGMPKTADDAHALADLDKFRFERWAAALVDGMEPNRKQRGDRGIDGWGRLPIRKGVFLDVVSQVKGGSTGPGHVQAFNGARQQAGADLGIFTCFDNRVTSAMRDAAASAGRFMEVPRVQIYTIEDYFADRKPVMPKAA